MSIPKPKSLWSMALILAGLSAVTSAYADTLVDRGLPSANLNNAAGSDRSNVAWVDGGYTSPSYVVEGDTFQNTSSDTWKISTIRLWTVGTTSSATLWGGVDGSTIGVASNSGVISSTTYADGSLYQGYSGAYKGVYQVDFAVNITLAAGQKYDFFLDGTGGQYTIPFASASNAALSGSPQDGADGSLLYASITGGNFDQGSVASWTSFGGTGSYDGGWDKVSDLNVQVIGAPIPEPETYAMLLAGLGLLGFMARRRKQKTA